jgi:hypothetical protein
LEDYDYKSYIIRSTADFDLNINQPYSTQALPALVNVTTHDREQLQSKAIYVQDQFVSQIVSIRLSVYVLNTMIMIIPI